MANKIEYDDLIPKEKPGEGEWIRTVRCANCSEYKNEWCEKIIDSPYPEMLRDCQYFHEKDHGLVKVTRCKDCKHWDTSDPWIERCKLHKIYPGSEFYCASGERENT